MATLPDEIRSEVIAELYRQADELDWELLPTGEKSAQYVRWIEDPTVGGVLLRYMSADRAPTWIKDTPMKEYARAQEGFGSLAGFVRRRYPGPDDLVERALGPAWSVVDQSLGEKPMHCTATDGPSHRYVCWGPPRNIRDLIWAAVNNAVETGGRPLVIVTRREGVPLDSPTVAYHQALAEHCQLDIEHISRKLKRV